MTDNARLEAIFEESRAVKAAALEQNREAILQSSALIQDAFFQGRKLLVFGNGGSAADSQHMAAEFVGRFQQERQALPALALTTDTSALTALANDYGFETVFARQIEALGQPGDVAMGISTSGRSPNIIAAFERASSRGLKTIGLTGQKGESWKNQLDVAIVVPSSDTARIQETHICIIHAICDLVESQMTA